MGKVFLDQKISGVGKAKAQKRSEAWQLGSLRMTRGHGRGGNGSSCLDSGPGNSFMVVYSKIPASHVSFHNCFFC